MRFARLLASFTAGALLGCAPPIGPGDAPPPNVVVVDGPAPPPPPVQDGGPPLVPGNACVGLDISEGETVLTESGFLQGVFVDGMRRWLGVPFAAQPVGARRFAPPEPFGCFDNGTRQALEFGARCLQRDPFTNEVVGDEDCLTLNVWAPPESVEPRPVLFFIHGGANVIGSSSEPLGNGVLYDGADLALDGDAVVVTVNYRLGALGFLAHESLRDESGAVGNWALLDLVRALEWVQENIRAFGGDPDRVMIFGESAGGLAVCSLLATDLTEGLFSAALMQSGGCDAAPQVEREGQGADAATVLGCDPEGDVATCLRATNAQDFLGLPFELPDLPRTWWMTWGPTVDGRTLADSPIAVLEAGVARDVAFVAGSNATEQNLFAPPGTITTCLQYDFLVRSSLDDAVENEALLLYPCLAYPTPHLAYVALSTDAAFTCQARRAVRAMAAHGTRDAWRYWFADQANWGVLAPLGAFHAWELFYVFDQLANVPGYLPSGFELDLSDRMQQHWASLARAGTPSDLGADLAWPAYDDDEPVLVFDELVSTVAVAGFESRCDFWDGLVP